MVKDCRPSQQTTNGQLDYLIAPQLPTHCLCCGKVLPSFRDPSHDCCDGYACIVKPPQRFRDKSQGKAFLKLIKTIRS